MTAEGWVRDVWGQARKLIGGQSSWMEESLEGKRHLTFFQKIHLALNSGQSGMKTCAEALARLEIETQIHTFPAGQFVSSDFLSKQTL